MRSSSKATEVIRRVLVCLAFATGSFLNFWIGLSERRTVYFLRGNPAVTTLPKVIAWELILTLAMLAAWEVCRRKQRDLWVIHVLFVLACLFPFGIGAMALARVSPLGLTSWIQARLFGPVAIVVAALLFGVAVWRPAASGRLLRSLLLWSWLVLSVAILQAAATMIHYRSIDYRDQPQAARLGKPPQEIRVVWIIFDELSQAVAFTHRPQDLELANFDRLKNESFYATAALPPAAATLVSMPSLILGEKVLGTGPDGTADLRIQTAVGWSSWRSSNNVFDTARQAGFNTALVGWYHPYGRVLNRSLTECIWVPTEVEPGVEEGYALSIVTAMEERMSLQIASLPLAGRLRRFSPRRYERRVRARDFEELRRRALEVAADPGVGMMLLHLPVPHPPGIDSDAGGYIENVALADRTLGDLRRAIEQAGLWNRTAIIVSADHGWRIGLWRPLPEWTPQEEAFASMNTSEVPFLVKLPRQSDPVVYEKPFDTVVTRKIISAILGGQITNAGQIEMTLH